jgi:exodeoxyribonuclease VII large subunit
MRVVVTGKVTVYAAQGKYQLDCISMQPEGIGDLYVAFEKLKRDLAERGYFDPSRKRRIPVMPQRIGIATSETGAAVRDMITTIERRFPAVTIVLRPTLVQGEGASSDIAQAIRDLEAARVDVMIIGRGGGSIEDLWSFNTLEVADAIFASAVPIISAVGHETDVTIADFVADMRAATPTAAAELVTATTLNDIMYSIDLVTDAMSASIADHISHLSEIAGSFADGRALRRITERMQLRAQRIQDLSSRISSAVLRSIQQRRREIDSSAALLATLHPLAPLSRGYAVVERNGKPLEMDHVLEPGDIVQVRRQTETSTVLVQTTQPSTLQSNQ